MCLVDQPVRVRLFRNNDNHMTCLPFIGEHMAGRHRTLYKAHSTIHLVGAVLVKAVPVQRD